MNHGGHSPCPLWFNVLNWGFPLNRWCIAGVVWLSLILPIVADESFLEKVNLFEAGKDGYALYRIPGIVVTKNGAVLAYCEARKNAGGDWGHIDLMFRRSTDGGKTWQPHLLFANPNNPNGRERKNLSVRLSYDDGATWKYTKALEAGASGYSDLANAQDGTILCFYERGAAEKNMYRTRWLTVARFNLEWLTDGKDAQQRAKK
jgi:Neuraminidase (sialidase)